MTSKAPARAAEDVDETALSYAEIKALATGNPQIIEKRNLDMEVSKLNMLRASHLSQRYALEELVLRKYPAEIKELSERIAGYEQDSARLAEHPKPAEGIAPMVLNDVTYAERENAGKAIIEACTHMNGAETVSIGSYRGFSMLLSYDGAANEFRMVLKGSCPIRLYWERMQAAMSPVSTTHWKRSRSTWPTPGRSLPIPPSSLKMPAQR